MKKLFGLLFSFWVLAALGLLALGVLIWMVGPLVSIGTAQPLRSETTRLIVIGVIVGLFLVVQIWKALRARSTNKAVVDTMLAEVPKPAANDPAAAEVAVLQERFERALTTLKNARFADRKGVWASAAGRVGKRYLYELPWYMIIGAPGSGKTTALLHSGLEFPLAASLGDPKVQGVGGTRNCDWWFTDQAVLIDTAGRYTTQDSHRETDQKAWNGFLAMIKKSRPRQPLNGILMTVSVPDLITRNAASRAEYAAAVRTRLHELHEHLGIRFPVYLLVTKCDLLAGFTDYLGDCSPEQRQEPWGFTFPLSAQQTTDTSSLATEFDLLSARLTDGLVDRLQSERDVARRARIYAFPQQFAGLREVLDEFVQKAFSPSQYEERPLLRGVYFISGTQEGTPIDRLLGAISRNYRLARTPLPVNQTSGKSFFLAKLLQEVVFAEANLAGTNLKWERRRTLLAVGGYTVVAAVFIAAVAAWTVSYFNNRRYVAAVDANAEGVRQLIQTTPNQASSDLRILLPLLAATKALAAERQGSAPWSSGFGLYQGGKLDSATQRAYKRMLVDAVQPRIALLVEELLRNSFDNPELQYEVLKAYVMLHDADHFDAQALRLFVTSAWGVSLQRDVTVEQRAALEAHLDALLAQGATVSPLPEDKALVAQVRAKLASVPLAQRVYTRIRQAGVGADIPEFTIAKAAGPNAATVFGRASGKPISQGVPGLYTFDGYRRGFQEVVQRTTTQLRDEEGWVLGVSDNAKSVLSDPSSLPRLTDDVRRLYLTDYAKLWEAYIADIRLLPMGNLSQSVQMARILSAPDNPLVPLIKALVRETTLTAADSKSVVEQIGDKAKSTSQDLVTRMLGSKAPAPVASASAPVEAIVDDRFENLRQLVKAGPSGGPAPIDGTIALINEAYAQLTAADTAVKTGNAPQSSTATSDRIKGEAARLPEPLRSLLNTLSAAGNSASASAMRTNLSSAVNANVGEFCRSAITNRYPFVKTGTSDVTQEDFSRLFSPGGLFDDFFQKNLATLVDTSARPWRYRPLAEGSMGGNPATLAQFQRAAVIRDTFFRSGGKTAGLRLDFKPIELDASIDLFSLDVDGQVVRYQHGPQVSTPVQWPGPKGSGQVRVQLQPSLANGGSSGIVTEGPWALFKLFDKLQVAQSGGPERFTVVFNIDNRKATFEVTASSVVNPFRLRELSEFSCPSSL